MKKARIIGTGHYLPENVVTNDDLSKVMDTTDEWIRQRTGIHQRHFSAEHEATSDLATHAARSALLKAGVGAEELDLIVLCTTTPDYYFPGTSCVVQANLGATNAAAIDVNAACSGFMYGLSTANAYIQSGMYETILVIGAECIKGRINMKKRDTAVLFGDGAGAVVVRAEEGDHGILTFYLGSDGTCREILIMHAGGSRIPYAFDSMPSEEDRNIQMDGKELFKKAVTIFGHCIQKGLEDSGVSAEELDLFVPHQANSRIILSVAQRMGLPEEKVVINLDKVGNTIAASVPIALDQAVEAGRLKAGDNVLLASFGGGLTWSASMVKW